MTQSVLPASVVAELVAAARGYLRMPNGVEGALLARLAAAAVGLGERFLGQAMFVRLCEDVLPVSTAWQRLRVAPVVAIQGVMALPIATNGWSATPTGAPSVLAVGGYAIDIDAGGDGWVRVAAANGAGRVAVSYTAGLADGWAALPEPIAQGCVALVAHLFEHRDGVAMPPAAVAALWRPFRRMQLAEAVR